MKYESILYEFTPTNPLKTNPFTSGKPEAMIENVSIQRW
jgi:hypothetical protein